METMPVPKGGKRIDKVTKMGWAMLDSPGVPYIAAKNTLSLDALYQRTMISESRVASICQAWSWAACGFLIVAERDGEDGRLYIIDGGHRWAAAMRRSDIQELPCLVFKTTSSSDEALIFYRVNCIRGAVTPFDRLRAMLAARDQTAIDAVTLIQKAGYEPSKNDEHRTIRCIAKFLSLVKSDRAVLEKAWPITAELHDGLGIKERVLSAIVYIAKYGSDDITKKEWRERIIGAGLHRVNDAIDRVCSAYVKGGAKAYATGALEVFNKGVRVHNRLRLIEPNEGDE